jgi:hypothetical protein
MTTLTAPIDLDVPATGRATLWTARIVGGVGVAFLIFDVVLKVLELPPAIETSVALGIPAAAVLPVGLIELACLALYLWPRTAPIGAVLFTGYLGGAIAIHLVNESPLFSHLLFPLYVATMLWLPLYLRDARVRALVAPGARS